MKIFKAYKFRMYPSTIQEHKINSFIGTSRFIYNYYLNKKEITYKESKINLTLSELKKDLVNLQKEYEWLKEVDGCILRTTLDDLDNAYTRFFKKQGGYPKYKRKSIKGSYKTVCIRSTYKDKGYSNISVDLKKQVIKLPKLGEVKIRGYRTLNNFNFKILNVTVSKVGKRYYVSVCVEEKIEREETKTKNIIGIDLGVKTLITTSDGEKYENITITKEEKRIKKLQRRISRSERGSKNRNKLIVLIEREYEKIKNKRKYHIHKITNKIVKENDIIVIESLNVKEMIEKGTQKLSKYISESSLGEIIRQLEYKSESLNKKIYKINKYYPSSQICNHCNHKEKRIKDLSIRKWECSKCGATNDRDINASINILFEGVKMYMKELLI